MPSLLARHGAGASKSRSVTGTVGRGGDLMTVNRAESDKVEEGLDEKTDRILNVLEDYLRQLEEGDQPRLDELVSQYPELSEVLPDYIQELDELHEAASAAVSSAANEELTPASDSERGRLGDFRILRELGRGGM